MKWIGAARAFQQDRWTNRTQPLSCLEGLGPYADFALD